MLLSNKTVVVVGLGYVGLPLAVEFQKKYETVGFDINLDRIEELCGGVDNTKEIEKNTIANLKNLTFTSNQDLIKEKDFYVVTVPTPIDSSKKPDLSALRSASLLVGKSLGKGSIVIYESTVYPGATEEICVPILEKESGLQFNKDFFCGYSPERVNPGDKNHTIPKIVKVTSGSDKQSLEIVDALYKSIITAGTYPVSSIRVAEAAKVIENTQRDINIAFINELAIVFNKLKIDTKEVLDAAGTKWNFLPFKPGLVGGHCIGVDPYYLTYKAEQVGHHPEIILAGRRLNDNMGVYIANQFVKNMISKEHKVFGAKILILGLTFKENCPDIRNTKVIDLFKELKEFGCNVCVYDPQASKKNVLHEYGINLIDRPCEKYDGIILAVAHREFLEINLKNFSHNNTILFDLKSILPLEAGALRL